MNNLFTFDYITENLKNQDSTPSNFHVVYGDEGKVMHCKKDNYKLVSTIDLSAIGHTFLNQGLDVKSWTHRNGEVIGLNIDLGKKPTKVGDKQYNAIITVPNNGGGKGYFTIQEERLICTNGMTQKLTNSKGSIKVPHKADYNTYLKLMGKAIQHFTEIIEFIELRDANLDDKVVTIIEAKKHLNEWFYKYEMPTSHKSDMTLDEFRKALYMDTESIKSYHRYQALMSAFNLELGYNDALDLKLSMYTVFATITNYLSRRIEASNSTAATETQFARASAKLAYFEAV